MRLPPIQAHDGVRFLNCYRAVHFGGLGPIPIDAVIDYCCIHEIDGTEARRDMLDMVAAINEDYLVWQREKDGATNG